MDVARYISTRYSAKRADHGPGQQPAVVAAAGHPELEYLAELRASTRRIAAVVGCADIGYVQTSPSVAGDTISDARMAAEACVLSGCRTPKGRSAVELGPAGGPPSQHRQADRLSPPAARYRFDTVACLGGSYGVGGIAGPVSGRPGGWLRDRWSRPAADKTLPGSLWKRRRVSISATTSQTGRAVTAETPATALAHDSCRGCDCSV